MLRIIWSSLHKEFSVLRVPALQTYSNCTSKQKQSSGKTNLLRKLWLKVNYISWLNKLILSNLLQLQQWKTNYKNKRCEIQFCLSKLQRKCLNVKEEDLGNMGGQNITVDMDKSKYWQHYRRSTVSECMLGMVLNFISPIISCNLSKQCRLWSNTAFCSFWSGSALFADVPDQVLQIILFTQHSEVTGTRIAWLQITVTWISYKCMVWFHWSMI